MHQNNIFMWFLSGFESAARTDAEGHRRVPSEKERCCRSINRVSLKRLHGACMRQGTCMQNNRCETSAALAAAGVALCQHETGAATASSKRHIIFETHVQSQGSVSRSTLSSTQNRNDGQELIQQHKRRQTPSTIDAAGPRLGSPTQEAHSSHKGGH